MKKSLISVRSISLTVLLFGAFTLCAGYAFASTGNAPVTEFPPDLQSYNDAGQSILDRLIHRVKVNPFNLVGSIIFLFAIIHTFLASKFTAISHRMEHEHEAKKTQGLVPRNSVAQGSRFMHFMGEVEVVFGLWAVALMIAVVLFFDWSTAVDTTVRLITE